jgi:hypothetical protein
MEVKNRVEFSRSSVIKKTEQEIVEGMLGNNEKEDAAPNTDVYETTISTVPVTIHVKPVPANNKPAAFNGAVGNFKIESAIRNDHLGKDEEGKLVVKITGTGNFMEIPIPEIQWPEGVEGFEGIISDELDKNSAPFKGSRTYTYSFLSTKPGFYSLPAVHFSFFNSDSGKYKTVSTSPLTLTIDNNSIKQNKNNPPGKSYQASPKRFYLWLTGVVIIIFIAMLIVRFRREKPERIKENAEQVPSAEHILSPAKELINKKDDSFYVFIRNTVWVFLAERFNLSGSEMNKDRLLKVMQEDRIDSEIIKKVLALLQHCEQGSFTTAQLSEEKTELLNSAKEIMISLRKSYS